jgi:hypothetical protein
MGAPPQQLADVGVRIDLDLVLVPIDEGVARPKISSGPTPFRWARTFMK